MQVKILKSFKWSQNNRLVSYKEGQIAEVTLKDGESMLKHGYAESYKEEPEAKMFKHEVIEDKMMHFNVENKAERPSNRRSRKQKGVDNE